MIVTVTPNPSVDRTVHIGTFRRGAVHRATASQIEPSGKGVNVAVAVHGAGHAVTAIVPVGGHSGRQLAALLDGLRLPFVSVPIGGNVRTNVTLIEDDGTTSKVNEPGPSLSPGEVEHIVQLAMSTTAPGDCVAWCGSLPAGFTDADLAGAIAALRNAGRVVVLDTSGSALALVLAAGTPHTLPHVIKPNRDELAELSGAEVRTLRDAIDAATQLVRRGVETVLVSLGADGALLVDREHVLYGHARAGRVVNSAGAGDAFLAGYLAAARQSPHRRLESALRFGASAVLEGGTLLRRADPRIAAWSGPPDPRRLLVRPGNANA